MRVLIIGYGNPWRGDDGAGPAAAEALRSRLPGASILVQQQITPELAEPVSEADLVIFIDAAIDIPPGEIRRAEVLPGAGASAFTHELTPGAILHMARILYGRSPQGTLYSIGGSEFGLNETMSSAVARSVAVVVDEVAAVVLPKVIDSL
jgi:hydrogenase maturation protease